MTEAARGIQVVEMRSTPLEVDDERREKLCSDIGKYTLIRSSLDRRISEKSGARALARFFFRPLQWRDDRYWVARYHWDQEILDGLSSSARTVLVGEMSNGFYETQKDLAPLYLIREDAFCHGKRETAVYEKVGLENPRLQVEP